MKTLMILLGLCVHLPAQQRMLAFGAENESTGNIMSVAQNEQSTLGNPSGLAQGDSMPTVSLSTLMLLYLSAFSRHNLSVHVPWGKTHVGLSLNRYGSEIYQEHRVSVALAQRIRHISLGIALGFYQCHAQGYGSKTRALLDMGGTLSLSSKCLLGMYITNVTQSRLSTQSSDVLATVMSLGLRYRALQNVTLLAEVEKHISYKPDLKIGLAYTISKLLKTNIGLNTLYKRVYVGVGINSRKISFWCSYSYNYYLLSGIQLTLKYSLK